MVDLGVFDGDQVIVGPDQPVHEGDLVAALLPEGRRARCDAAYRAAREEAKTSYQLDRLNEVVQAWWQLAWARRSPTHAQAVETGERLLRGDQVETFPVDLDALRR